ncbi:MAG: HD domain-containing phosphohydrolase [Polyangiaceae bacterium]
MSAPIVASSKTRIVCDVLLRDRRLKVDQLDGIVARLQWSGERVEEAILELGLVGESDLLKSLAGYYQSVFVSSEKLARAEVTRALVDMMPQRFVEKIGVCPVAFDAKAHSLSVVTADPDDLESLREVQLASGAREVRPVLARPAAVKALIAKVYGGDAHAFAIFERRAQASSPALVDRGGVVISTGGAPVMRADAKGTARERLFEDRELERSSAVKAPPGKAGPPLLPPLAAMPQAERGLAGSSFIELLHVLVSLLESSRADLRGHSAQVARLVRPLTEKLGLEPETRATFIAAAFVHDLGKMGQYHLTTLNCSEYDGHKAAAQRACSVPARLLDPVRLPAATIDAVAHMYERYDGLGFPDGYGGKDIPLGARVLAVCDTYADLTSNPRNPFRTILSPRDACAALTQYKDTIFDPNLVDLLKNTVLGEELAVRLLANRHRALVVDLDPEETTVLELRMSEQGFVVKTVRSADQAMKILSEGETDLVVGEIDLGADDGLALLAEARREAWGKDLPWVIYTRRQERAAAQKAFELGVLDYVTKPASADVFVAKLKALLEQRVGLGKSGGVSGSLREMGLPDMVQVLFQARKNGNLKIRARDGGGEIHFSEGNVVDATWRELRGEEAFYALVRLTDGDFALDPSFRPATRVIHQSSEALLLEAMRRMDEGS